MLLNFKELVKKYDMKIEGVIHAGAHFGEEIPEYRELGIKKGYFFEPCKEAFDILEENCPGYYNCFRNALGDWYGPIYINTETSNRGQSNSILKPVKHLEYYPDIKFNNTEAVWVMPLDFFIIKRANLLVMDVQGYELEVLKGAVQTLQYIDYIYTEVNKEELYEDCAMVDDLDKFLTDFERVETKWTNKGWGDALYKRKK